MPLLLHPTTHNLDTGLDRCPRCRRILGARGRRRYVTTDSRAVILEGRCPKCRTPYKIIRTWRQIQREYEAINGQVLIAEGRLPDKRDADEAWARINRTNEELQQDLNRMWGLEQ